MGDSIVWYIWDFGIVIVFFLVDMFLSISLKGNLMFVLK